MIDRRFLNSFLRLNKITADTPSVEVQTILTAANWSPEDIIETLKIYSRASAGILPNPPNQSAAAFRPDVNWTSSKLSALLGTDVVVDPQSFHATLSKKNQFAVTLKKFAVGLCIAIIAIAIASSIGLGLLFFFEVGPFYTYVGDII